MSLTSSRAAKADRLSVRARFGSSVSSAVGKALADNVNNSKKASFMVSEFATSFIAVEDLSALCFQKSPKSPYCIFVLLSMG